MKLLFVISIIIIAFISTFFILVNQQNEIHVEANFYNVLEQLNYPSNWEKWQSSLQQACSEDSSHCVIKNDTTNKAFSIEIPEHIFYVKKTSPLTFEVREKLQNNLSVYAIAVVSTTLPNKTNVVTIRRVSLFNYIFGNNKKNTVYITTSNLKAFLENPTAFYGYALKIENIVDTNVVVTERIVAKKNLRQELTGMYDSITHFIHANNLTVVQTKIASLKIISKDSIEIKAGIPVNKTAPASGAIKCLKMPKGQMLVGEFKGTYCKKISLLNAMEKYISDHIMVIVAVPYEKYLNDSIPATDTSIVKLRMYYPVL